MRKQIALALFFNSDHKSLESFYGPPCTSRVVQGLESLDSAIPTQILRGDLLPHNLAYDISKVSVGNKYGTTGVSREYKPNMERYKLLLCDLAESLAAGFNTIDENSFLFSMARQGIWTIVITAIYQDHARELDNKLNTFEPYLGAAEIDAGNPIHMSLFDLIGGAFFRDGRLFYRSEPEMEEAEVIDLAKSYGASLEPIILGYEEDIEKTPSSLTPKAISDRGKLSLARFEGKTKLTHHQRVAESLLNYIESNHELVELDFSVDIDKETLEFLCEKEKVKNYLLNSEHPDGGSKARFFGEVLGIEQQDWRFLADQITQGMKNSVLFKTKATQHGISHRAFLMITGRNGRYAVIQTGWEIKKGGSARLVTAYPESKYQNEKFSPNPDNVVSPSLSGDERWSAIYDRAHAAGIEAAKITVPTPMNIEEYPTIFAGACGFAWVHVPDARTGMAFWLRNNNIGHKGYPSGWVVSAHLRKEDLTYGDTQSIEPKEAYAKVFADVLKANGVECSVGSRLD